MDEGGKGGEDRGMEGEKIGGKRRGKEGWKKGKIRGEEGGRGEGASLVPHSRLHAASVSWRDMKSQTSEEVALSLSLHTSQKLVGDFSCLFACNPRREACGKFELASLSYQLHSSKPGSDVF